VFCRRDICSLLFGQPCFKRKRKRRRTKIKKKERGGGSIDVTLMLLQEICLQEEANPTKEDENEKA